MKKKQLKRVKQLDVLLRELEALDQVIRASATSDRDRLLYDLGKSLGHIAGMRVLHR
jgi:hypothetical protein